MTVKFLDSFYFVKFPLLVTLTLTTACKPRVTPASEIDAAPQARAILGPAVPWAPLELDATQVNQSMKKRRAAAWKSMEQVLQRIQVSHPETGDPLKSEAGEPITIPVWQTWYEHLEFAEMMQDLWKQLTPEQKEQRFVDEELVDKIIARHHKKKLRSIWENDGVYTPRFTNLLSQVGSDTNLSALNGVSGRGYTLHSPGTVRHYLLNYPAMIKCRGHAADFTTGEVDKDFATCLTEPFPKGAATIKATWVNVNDGIADFDTSAAGIAQTMTAESPTWTPINPDDLEFPDNQSAYTSSTYVNENEHGPFRLTGLHLTNKDIPEWMWVSLWWSPRPDEDFGEDRPPQFSTLGPKGAPAVWSNYKMCVASTFDEADEEVLQIAGEHDSEGWLAVTDKSLRSAIGASTHFSRPGTWCSNPFIEFQEGAANTNCIGCHQHAGPFSSRARMQNDRSKVRKSFMTDFLWSYESHKESFRAHVIDTVFADF